MPVTLLFKVPFPLSCSSASCHVLSGLILLVNFHWHDVSILLLEAVAMTTGYLAYMHSAAFKTHD